MSIGQLTESSIHTNTTMGGLIYRRFVILQPRLQSQVKTSNVAPPSAPFPSILPKNVMLSGGGIFCNGMWTGVLSDCQNARMLVDLAARPLLRSVHAVVPE